MIAMLTYIALLIAPDGHVTEVRDLASPEDCVAVIQAFKSEVRGGRGTCVRVSR